MRRPKTGYRRLVIQDFTGGLNTEKSEFDIANNEFTVFQNIVLEFGGPRMRGGFQIEYGFPKPVLAAFQRNEDIYLIFEDGEFGVYNTASRTYAVKGTITDQITVIPKMVWFDPSVVMTVGDSVWVYDTASDTLTKTTSPAAKDLLVKYGRVVIASGDEVWLSRVGDPTDWTPDSTDASSAQYFQIGYKEGKDITAINHFLDDILVFKEDRIYQLIGMSEVKLLNSKRGAINNSATVSLMSDVYAIDKNGFYSVVRDRFVDVVAGDLDLKVKTVLRDNINSNIRVFYSPTLRAFIIKGVNESFLYFYEYGSFSIFKTELPIDIYLDEGQLYGLGQNLYLYKKAEPYDSSSGYIAEDNEEIASDTTYIYELARIKGEIRTKLFSLGRVNIIKVGYTLKNIFSNGTLQLQVGKKNITHSISLNQKIDRHVHTNQVVDSFDFFISADIPLSITRIYADYIVMEA